jgi:hypothetical protein
MPERTALVRRLLPVALVVGGCALVVALILSAVGRLPGSPEALFREFQRLNAAGDLRGIWNLYVDEGQKDFRDTIARARETYWRNRQHPENRSMYAQYNVTEAEFYALDAGDIFIREMSPPERRGWMEGARILDIAPYPDGAGDQAVHWEMADGRLFVLRCRDTGHGFGVVVQHPMGRLREPGR